MGDRWWDRNDELVERYTGQLQSDDVRGFLEAAEIATLPRDADQAVASAVEQSAVIAA